MVQDKPGQLRVGGIDADICEVRSPFACPIGILPDGNDISPGIINCKALVMGSSSRRKPLDLVLLYAPGRVFRIWEALPDEGIHEIDILRKLEGANGHK